MQSNFANSCFGHNMGAALFLGKQGLLFFRCLPLFRINYRLATAGKMCSKFPPFVDNGGLITFSTQDQLVLSYDSYKNGRTEANMFSQHCSHYFISSSIIIYFKSSTSPISPVLTCTILNIITYIYILA